MLTLPLRHRAGAQRTSAQKRDHARRHYFKKSKGESLPLTATRLTLQDPESPDSL